MSDTWNIRDCFEQMRFDKGVHLGLGDIRLSIGTQDDICDLVEQHHGKPGEVARLRAENEGYRDLLTLLSDTLPPTQGGTLCRKALAGKEGAK